MNNSKVQCEICGKLFYKCGIQQHRQWHINEDRRQKEREERKLSSVPEYFQIRDDLFCQYCGKSYKNMNSLKQHEIRCPENANRRAYQYLAKYSHENFLGQTKDTNEVIKRVADAIQQKYKDGWISPNKGVNRPERHYAFINHNNEELQKWIDYVSKLKINIPEYNVYNNGGYRVVSNSILTNEYNERNGTSTILLEHIYFMTLIFGDNYKRGNVVHHIDENKSNNSFSNLILFESTEDHVRYHTSDNAYLVYDEDTHKFRCVIK